MILKKIQSNGLKRRVSLRSWSGSIGVGRLGQRRGEIMLILRMIWISGGNTVSRRTSDVPKNPTD
jgi:hypothetical protein